MKTCPRCKQEMRDAADRCPQCAYAYGPPQTTLAMDPAATTWLLTILGLLCAGVGLYYLLVEPSAPDATDFLGTGRGTVNLHRLYLGQTLTIVGAIFLAVAWRPR